MVREKREELGEERLRTTPERNKYFLESGAPISFEGRLWWSRVRGPSLQGSVSTSRL